MSGNEYDERPGGRIRIGDQEREDAVKRLGAHYEAGRLTAEEHTERVGDALQAKTEAELAAVFADLPGEGGAATEGAAEDVWAGPFGWARPPWTAPDDQPGGGASGSGASGGSGGPGDRGRPGGWGGPGRGGPGGRGAGGPWGAGAPWAQRKGPLGRIPLPVLIALAVLGVVASIACTVGGGHPPILPLLLIIAAVVIVKNGRRERRA